MDLSNYVNFDPANAAQAELLLVQFNLQTSAIGKRNKVLVHPDAAPMAAVISFHGDDNVVQIGRGGVFRGELVFIGSRSRVVIHDEVHANTLQATLYSDAKFEIGAKTVCYGLRAWVSDQTIATIGEGCQISEGVSLRTTDHHSIFDIDTLDSINIPQSVVIRPCVWLGHDVMILKGVEVGTGSIIGARALVTRSVPPMELWSGSPAHMMRQRVSWHSSLPVSKLQLHTRLDDLAAIPAAAGIASKVEPAIEDSAELAITSQWIDALYRKVLMRPPEEGVIQLHARNALINNVGPAELLDGMFRCAEFADISPAFLTTYVGPTKHFSDHSQSGEATFLIKEMINEAANHGFLVDVGARGRERSNSYDLLRYVGWRGLLIEANPRLISTIARDFADLDFQLINCAVADYDGESEFYFGINDDVSSLMRNKSAEWGEIRGQCKIQVRRLPDILKEANVPEDFDLLSLDIEGYDIAVLNDLIDGSRFRPKRIIMEVHEANLVTNLMAIGLNASVVEEFHIVGSVGANLVLRHRFSPAG